MKKIVFYLACSLLVCQLQAQQPQIARVNAQGATTIYVDLKTAINEAGDDDFIYVPGAAFTADSISIKKRIHIVGTGHYPDSTTTSGATTFNLFVFFLQGCDGASIQGIKTKHIYTYELNNSVITIAKCYINGQISSGGISVTNTTANVTECVISQGINGNNGVRFVVNKCIIPSNGVVDFAGYAYALYDVRNSIVTNCIFPFAGVLFNSTNSTFTHNIFYTSFSGLMPTFLDAATTNFSYNLLTDASSYPTIGVQTEVGNLAEGTFNNTFKNVTAAGFNYTFDYRLKTTSVGNNVGGSAVGLYPVANPYNPTPYNPHIYFKNIAATTNAQGQLQINIKVQAQ